MKFDPPVGRMLLAWRLTYFGAAVVFLTGAVFLGIGGNPDNKRYVAILFGIPFFISIASAFIGLFLSFTGEGEDAK